MVSTCSRLQHGYNNGGGAKRGKNKADVAVKIGSCGTYLFANMSAVATVLLETDNDGREDLFSVQRASVKMTQSANSGK